MKGNKHVMQVGRFQLALIVIMECFLLTRVCNQLEDTGTAVSSVANMSGESKI